MPLVAFVEVVAMLLEGVETTALTADAVEGRGARRVRPRRAVVAAGWLASVASGALLVYWFDALYDRAPGWTAAAVGVWMLLAFATLVATIDRHRAQT
jgi:hypothetical protein